LYASVLLKNEEFAIDFTYDMWKLLLIVVSAYDQWYCENFSIATLYIFPSTN